MEKSLSKRAPARHLQRVIFFPQSGNYTHSETLRAVNETKLLRLFSVSKGRLVIFISRGITLFRDIDVTTNFNQVDVNGDIAVVLDGRSLDNSTFRA